MTACAILRVGGARVGAGRRPRGDLSVGQLWAPAAPSHGPSGTQPAPCTLCTPQLKSHDSLHRCGKSTSWLSKKLATTAGKGPPYPSKTRLLQATRGWRRRRRRGARSRRRRKGGGQRPRKGGGTSLVDRRGPVSNDASSFSCLFSADCRTVAQA